MNTKLIAGMLCAAWLVAGAEAFAAGPKVAFLIGEDEYKTSETLPEFAERELEPRGVECVWIHADPKNPNHFPGIERIDGADALFLSVRRRPLPAAELKHIRDALEAGKGLVGIRTASHAFAYRAGATLDADLEQWPDFDTKVLGGKYLGHHGNALGADIAIAAGAKDNPLLTGAGDLAFHTAGSLYKSVDLNGGAQALLTGATTDAGKSVSYPVAWTNEYGKSRVFYTSLGHPDDFRQAGFNRLLVSAVYWAARREPPIGPVKEPVNNPKNSPAKDPVNNPVTGAADTQPTSPDEALKMFRMPDGFEMQLLAHEPTVAQPLFMTWDERGRLWLVQYRQYPSPAGLKVVKHDQYLRAVFDRVPAPPPRGEPGADKITVLADTDGDGRFDSVKDVITGLNICTAVAVGHGGIWVLNPPYLLFYPDANGDDAPDGDPEVRLSGFGLEDTHAVANSLKWGPDGWLYGANGSTTTGTINSEATKNVSFQGQMIWRYHPDRREFEIYAEGGGNTFSLEIDRQGRVFSGTNAGATRGMYYSQGSYAEKNWSKHGPLTNPYAFGYFKHMEHQGDKNRFSQAFLIYEGGKFPAEYTGQIISANSLHNQIWASRLIRQTSTYRTVDMPLLCTTADRWFRPVDVEVGPDGAVYVADWYDARLTHLDPRDTWHKSSGRLYRLQTRGAAPLAPFDLGKLSSAELIVTLGHANKWFRQQAVRLLSERGEPSIVPELAALVAANDPRALEALWVCHRLGAFHETPHRERPLALEGLASANEHVRRWTARLLGDDRRASPAAAAALVNLAATEPDSQVRSQLASAAKRLPADVGLPIARAMAARFEDVDDLHLPLLVWWAIESKAASDREAVLALWADAKFWTLPLVRQGMIERIMRRYASPGDDEDLQTCARLLALAPSPAEKDLLMAGLLEAFRGRRIGRLPPALAAALDAYETRVGQSDLALALRRGSAEAVTAALKIVADEHADKPTRLTYIEILGQTREPRAPDVFLRILSGSTSLAIKRTTLEALANFDNSKIGPTVAQLYHRALPDDEGVRAAAQRLLAARPSTALLLLAEVEKQTVAVTSIGPDVVQTLAQHADPAVARLVAKFWGKVRATPAEKQDQIARLKSLIRGGGGDPEAGHALYAKRCAACHTLFGEGGRTGPDLTSYERSNLDFLLTAVVDPNAAIREEYTSFAVVTRDGRTLAGLITDQDAHTLTLRGADGRATLLDREAIEDLHALPTSLMPENQLNDLSQEEQRDLFAYLTSRAPQQQTAP